MEKVGIGLSKLSIKFFLIIFLFSRQLNAQERIAFDGYGISVDVTHKITPNDCLRVKQLIDSLTSIPIKNCNCLLTYYVVVFSEKRWGNGLQKWNQKQLIHYLKLTFPQFSFRRKKYFVKDKGFYKKGLKVKGQVSKISS